VSIGSGAAFTGLAPSLFGNSFLPVNPLIAWTISGVVSGTFQVGRPNVQDMFVLPDPIGGIDGKGAPLMSSPFLREINSNIPSLNSVNAVPVINIYGTTKHEQPQYSIASTSLERYPSQPASELLCEPVPIRPQFQAIDNPKDGLVPKIIYQKIAPIYISTASAARTLALLSLLSGNPLAAAYGAFVNLQWSRGDGYLYRRAQGAYQTLIGAAVTKPLTSITIFGFRVVFFIQGRYDNLLESDAFIPEWSQKSPGAILQLEAEKTNHFMEANHPSMKRLFNNIFDNVDTRTPQFEINKK